MATVTREAFAKHLCEALALKPTKVRMNALVAWISAEGTSARFNPLATTKRMTGSTNFNKVGVQEYPDLRTGVEATFQTLSEHHGQGYELIVERLKVGTAAREILEAVADSGWGTGWLALQVLPYVKKSYSLYANKPIGQ